MIMFMHYCYWKISSRDDETIDLQLNLRKKLLRDGLEKNDAKALFLDSSLSFLCVMCFKYRQMF